MNIVGINSYRDGGTIRIITDEGDYCIDDRMLSKTIGKVFIGYPEDDNSNLDNFQDEIIMVIIDSLKNYQTYDNNSWSKWNFRILKLLNVC
jgi:hypothetical protein